MSSVSSPAVRSSGSGEEPDDDVTAGDLTGPGPGPQDGDPPSGPPPRDDLYAGAGWDDELDELLGSQPLLPADDRLWRHPSEVNRSASTAAAPVAAPLPRAVGTPVMAGVALGAGLVGALLAVMALRVTEGGDAELVIERRMESPPFAMDAGLGETPDISAVVASVAPSVARLTVEHDRARTDGSGIVVRSDGLVLTSARHVDGVASVQVTLSDGRQFVGDVLGTDDRTDVAVVDIDADDLTVVVMGDPTGLVIGQHAMTVGSPLGSEGVPTVTAGVVSALGRAVETVDGQQLHGLIQTDAAMPPGSAGGALVDARGAVVALTTAIVDGDPGSEGLGFATPIDVAYDVAVEISEDGVADHPWLGITGQPVAPVADGSVEPGIEVVSVDDGGPAADAGVHRGDVVTALDGERLSTMAELAARLDRYEPGDQVELSTHDGADRQVVLGTR